MVTVTWSARARTGKLTVGCEVGSLLKNAAALLFIGEPHSRRPSQRPKTDGINVIFIMVYTFMYAGLVPRDGANWNASVNQKNTIVSCLWMSSIIITTNVQGKEICLE